MSPLLSVFRSSLFASLCLFLLACYSSLHHYFPASLSSFLSLYFFVLFLCLYSLSSELSFCLCLCRSHCPLCLLFSSWLHSSSLFLLPGRGREREKEEKYISVYSLSLSLFLSLPPFIYLLSSLTYLFFLPPSLPPSLYLFAFLSLSYFSLSLFLSLPLFIHSPPFLPSFLFYSSFYPSFLSFLSSSHIPLSLSPSIHLPSFLPSFLLPYSYLKLVVHFLIDDPR